MKKQIISAFGLAALVGLGDGCEAPRRSPIKNMPEGDKSLTIPSECAELKSTSYSYISSSSRITITCKDAMGQDIVYMCSPNTLDGDIWDRYIVVRKDGLVWGTK